MMGMHVNQFCHNFPVIRNKDIVVDCSIAIHHFLVICFHIWQVNYVLCRVVMCCCRLAREFCDVAGHDVVGRLDQVWSTCC